jgi:hypothetical protein
MGHVRGPTNPFPIVDRRMSVARSRTVEVRRRPVHTRREEQRAHGIGPAGQRGRARDLEHEPRRKEQQLGSKVNNQWTPTGARADVRPPTHKAPHGEESNGSSECTMRAHVPFSHSPCPSWRQTVGPVPTIARCWLRANPSTVHRPHPVRTHTWSVREQMDSKGREYVEGSVIASLQGRTSRSGGAKCICTERKGEGRVPSHVTPASA